MSIEYIAFKVHPDSCGQFWPEETVRVWPEARRLHKADPRGAGLGEDPDSKFD